LGTDSERTSFSTEGEKRKSKSILCLEERALPKDGEGEKWGEWRDIPCKRNQSGPKKKRV